MNPVISIVIANYNYGRFLGDAIKSIVDQDGFDQCELIVVDGGSTDDSIVAIKKYEDKIAWWISERDQGQSEAFNKGFAHAKGRFLTWVNADDILVKGTIKCVLSFIERHPTAEWISGGIIYFNAENRVLKARIGAQPPRFFHKWFEMLVIGGPSSFFTKSRYEEVGRIDESLHYVMDIDLWRKFFNVGMKLCHVNSYFWGFRLHEASKTSATVSAGHYSDAHLKEWYEVDNRSYHRAPQWQRWVGGRFWLLYRVISGSLLRSVIDSYKYKGRKVI